MELKLLKSFHAVADLLHFGRAAVRIGVTQPALSQHIAKLEAELGVQLFERDRRNVSLTPAGTTLRDETTAALKQLEDALDSARRVGGQRDRCLKVGQLQYISHAFLPPAIQALKRERPDVLIKLIEMPPHEVVNAVRERWIDIGFGLTPMQQTDDLVTREVVRGKWVVWVPSNHPFAKLETVPVALAAQEPLIIFERSINPHSFDYLMGVMSSSGHAPRIAQQVQQPQHGIPLMLQGVGLFLVGSYVVDEVHRGAVMRPLSGFPNDLRVTAVWRPDGRTELLRPFLSGLPRLRKVAANDNVRSA